jgi:ABC-type oligopeptide transport system substrate-binding subunit
VRPVTAEDVVYGIEHRCMVDDCTTNLSARALDDTTLEISLPLPDDSFLNLTPTLRAMPQDMIETPGELWTAPGNLVTSGPFVLDEWIVGVRRVYLRNPFFPKDLRAPGNVQRVVVDILPQEQVAAASLELFQKSLLDMTRSGDEWLIQPWVTIDSFDSMRFDWITIDQAAQLIARKSWNYPTPEPLP